MKVKKYVLTAMLLMATMLFATGANAWFGLNATQPEYGNENSVIGTEWLYNATFKVLSLSSTNTFLASCSSAGTLINEGGASANATISSAVAKFFFVAQDAGHSADNASTFLTYTSTNSTAYNAAPVHYVTDGSQLIVTSQNSTVAGTTNLIYMVANSPLYRGANYGSGNAKVTNGTLTIYSTNGSYGTNVQMFMFCGGAEGNATTGATILPWSSLVGPVGMVNPFVAEYYLNNSAGLSNFLYNSTEGTSSQALLNSTGIMPLTDFFGQNDIQPENATVGFSATCATTNASVGTTLQAATDLFTSVSMIGCTGAEVLFKVALKKDVAYTILNGTASRMGIAAKVGSTTYEYVNFVNGSVTWTSPFDFVARIPQNSTTSSGNYRAWFLSNGSMMLYLTATSNERLEAALKGNPSYVVAAGSTGDVSLFAENGSLQGASHTLGNYYSMSAPLAAGTAKLTDASGPAPWFMDYQDTDFDGYINEINIYFLEALNTMSLAVTDFLIIDYSKGSNAGNTIHPTMFVNATAVAAADKISNITGNDAITLTLGDTEIKTGDYVRVLIKLADGESLATIADAASNVYNPYMGDARFDLLQMYYANTGLTTSTSESNWYQTISGTTYYPGIAERTGLTAGGQVVDRAGPAPTNASMTADNTIMIDMSEPVSWNGTSVTANTAVAKYFVMLDGSNATILDLTHWTFGMGGNQTTATINTAGGGSQNTNASEVSVLFLSQTGESITAATTMTDNATKGTNPYPANWSDSPNVAGGSDKTTYNPYRTNVGTLIAVENAKAPQFDATRQAVSLWTNGGYSTVLAYVTEDVNATTPADSTSPNKLAANFYVWISNADEDTANATQKLHPASVSVSSSQADTLVVTLPYTALSAQTGSMNQSPVWLQYVNPTNSTTNGTTSFIVGYTSGKAMASDCCTIQSLYSDRNASVRAVEIAGELKNFTSVAGARILAYQLYKYLTVTDVISLDITFEYGPLKNQTQNAFGITAKANASQTNDPHEAGNYAGIHILVDGAANVNGTIEDFIVGGADTKLNLLKSMINNGIGYLHTDWDADGFMNFKLSTNATSTANSDSVFPIQFTKNKTSTGYKIGAKNLKYDMKVSGTWTTVTGYRWLPVGNTGNIADLNPDTKGGTAAVAGMTVLPFDMADDNASYKCVAVDILGDLINATASRFNSKTGEAESLSATLTSAEKTVLSSITDAKWVFVLQKNDGTRVLLNGVTPDVAIDKYFWAVDGPQLYNFNYNQIYNYSVSNGSWNLLPLAWDKTYNKSKASGTKQYKVGSVSDAMIGLTSSYVPVVAPYASTVFTLDKNNGASLGAAQDVTQWLGGYAIAFSASDPTYAAADNGTIFNPVTMWTFGYNVSDMTGADFDDDYRLSTNVIDITENDTTKSDSARTSANKNLGWNLLANVQAYTLSSTSNVDYVVTFESGEFKSWIDGLNSDLDDLNDAMTSGGGTSARVLGKAYFVHTEKK